MMRYEETLRLRDQVVKELEKLNEITMTRAYLERLIELHQKYPRPYLAWRPKLFDPKTGKPVGFKWRADDYGKDFFTRIYTHNGFCRELPMSEEVYKGLVKLVSGKKSYIIAGFVVTWFSSAYNGDSVVAGLQISPLHQPEEL